jgi:hypothetical protein
MEVNSGHFPPLEIKVKRGRGRVVDLCIKLEDLGCSKAMREVLPLCH